MLTIIAMIGILITLMCAYGSANPPALLRLVDRFANRPGFIAAILIRVVLGIAAILAAPDSLAPNFLYVIGVIALAAAVALPIMGLARYRRLIDWVSAFSPAMMRLWLTGGLIFGVALVWATGLI